MDNELTPHQEDCKTLYGDAPLRKLSADWSLDIAEDMEAMHGIDVQTELMEHCKELYNPRTSTTDLEYFQSKLYQSLNIPSKFLNSK